MATIKSYSDLQQSKKLAEILPLESADMYYPWDIDSKSFLNIPIVKDDSYYVQGSIDCWSLTSLLSVLPYPFLSELSNEIWKCGCYPSGICYYVAADSPIDACYEMIVRLHELKML